MDRTRLARWLALALVAGAVVALLVTGAKSGLSTARLVQLIRDAGTWGVLGYLAAFSLVQPMGVSGHVFVLAAALVWSPWVAFALALAGATGAALAAFGFARFVAYDWVQRRLPERLRKYEAWIVERGLRGVLFFRLLTFTAPPAELLMGTVRVPFGRMLLATVLGFAPTVAFDVFLGGELLGRLLRWAGWA